MPLFQLKIELQMLNNLTTNCTTQPYKIGFIFCNQERYGRHFVL